MREQHPTGTKQVLHGTLTLNGQGSGHTQTLSLPAGHYKLVWAFAGEKGKAKFKVLWSGCAGVASPPPGSTVTSGGTVVGRVNNLGQIFAPNGAELARTGLSTAPLLGAASALLLIGVALRARKASTR